MELSGGLSDSIWRKNMKYRWIPNFLFAHLYLFLKRVYLKPKRRWFLMNPWLSKLKFFTETFPQNFRDSYILLIKYEGIIYFIILSIVERRKVKYDKYSLFIFSSARYFKHSRNSFRVVGNVICSIRHRASFPHIVFNYPTKSFDPNLSLVQSQSR